MSWTVNVIQNTLVTSEETAEKLVAFLDGRDYYLTQIQVGNKTMFELDSDAMEWIDFLANEPETIEILKADPETRGVIGFADFEGDNEGSVWGYSFGDRTMVHLKGRVVWDEIIT